MSLNSVKFIITTSYGIVSMILYALVNYILLTNKKLFGGSFFRLFIYQSFLNCLTYFNSMVTLRLPQNTCQNCTLAPIFAENLVPGLNYFHTVHYHMSFVQYFFTATISANRWSMMVSPISYEKFWSRATLPIIFLIILLPFIVTGVFPFNRSYYEYVSDPSSDWYVIRTTANLAVVYNYLIGFMIVITSLNTFFNISTLALLIFKSRENRAKKSEIFLIFHSFTGFVAEAFAATITVMNRLGLGQADSWYMKVGQLMVPFVSDSLTLAQPVLLIICSTNLRNCLKYLLTGQQNRVVELQSAAPTISVGHPQASHPPTSGSFQ